MLQMGTSTLWALCFSRVWGLCDVPLVLRRSVCARDILMGHNIMLPSCFELGVEFLS